MCARLPVGLLQEAGPSTGLIGLEQREWHLYYGHLGLCFFPLGL